jgi:hypothetical protein
VFGRRQNVLEIPSMNFEYESLATDASDERDLFLSRPGIGFAPVAKCSPCT